MLFLLLPDQIVAIIALPWYFFPASHPSLLYLPLPSVLQPSYSTLIYSFLPSKKKETPTNQPDLRHSCNGTENVKFTSPHSCVFLWHTFFLVVFFFFLLNILQLGLLVSSYNTLAGRDFSFLLCCKICLLCRTVLSSLM